MAECSKCGSETMSFTCKYCGEKYCSEHRLPENHDCNGLEEEIEKQKEESQKWFEEKEVKNPAPSKAKPKKPSLIKDIFRTFRNNATLSIITVTTFAFFLQSMVGGGLLEEPLSYFVLQSQLSDVLAQPWTLITVMFMHGGMFHLFANMVTLYFFGEPIEKTVGSWNFLKFYFLSGLAASIGFVAVRNILSLYQGLGVFGPAVGASGAVVACFAAVAMLYPRAEVLLYFVFPMKIKTALYAFGGLELFNLVAKAAGVYLPVIGGFASSAHLTGMIVGIWYGRKLRDKYANQRGVFDLFGA